MPGVKYPAIVAAAALVAVGAAAPFINLQVKPGASAPDILSILHKRSPEERPSGALTNKKNAVSMKLPAAVPAKAPVAPRMAAPAAAAVVPAVVPAVAPVVAAPVPVAVAAAPAAVPVAIVPAAASSFVIPPIIVPGGGGGGSTIVVTPPGGGGTPPPPVAGVPEPQTWAMMIIGFGLLGAFLRRRRRSGAENSPPEATGDVALRTGAAH